MTPEKTTADEVLSWGPCWDRDRLRIFVGDGLTAEDALAGAELGLISWPDLTWVLLAFATYHAPNHLYRWYGDQLATIRARGANAISGLSSPRRNHRRAYDLAASSVEYLSGEPGALNSDEAEQARWEHVARDLVRRLT